MHINFYQSKLEKTKIKVKVFILFLTQTNAGHINLEMKS